MKHALISELGTEKPDTAHGDQLCEVRRARRPHLQSSCEGPSELLRIED